MNAIKSTMTKHKECMEALGTKCRWEEMSRLAVLAEWPDIVCQECHKAMRQVRKKVLNKKDCQHPYVKLSGCMGADATEQWTMICSDCKKSLSPIAWLVEKVSDLLNSRRRN